MIGKELSESDVQVNTKGVFTNSNTKAKFSFIYAATKYEIFWWIAHPTS